jgi:hypothetical protein
LVPPVACSNEEALEAAEVMECQLASFPVKYLRIPLTVGPLPVSMLQPLVDIISFRLPLWKAGMMMKVGRLALVKSVLMPIALHQIVVLGLNKKALKKIERIVRTFVWTGRANANGGHCHVNWVRVCRPLSMGGLRILDLARTTINLRMHWLWRMRTDSLRPWRSLDMELSTIQRRVFHVSTNMVVGDRETAHFWVERWLDGRAIKEIVRGIFMLIPKSARQ